MSIASELTTLAANKAAIKAAIEAKNPATAPTDDMSKWASAIASIQSGSVGEPINKFIYYASAAKGVTLTTSNVSGTMSVVPSGVNYSNLYYLYVGEGTKTIGGELFHNYTTLALVDFPSSLETINPLAFNNCSRLTEAKFPDGLKYIGQESFYNCYRLNNVVIPDSVTEIGRSAFSGCGGLTSLTIGNGLTSIGYSAFIGCHSLINLTLANGLTFIGNDMFNSCGQLASVTIPSSVSSIGETAFSGCASDFTITLEGKTVAQIQAMNPIDWFGWTDMTVTLVGTDGSFQLVISCFKKGTNITLADGTAKKIEDLTYNDTLRVWDFDNGCLSSASICWLTRDGLKNDHYYQLTFSDGTVLNTTGRNSNHRIYNVDKRKFEGVDKTEVGDRIYSINGVVTVTDKQYIEEEVEYYNVITTDKINCFAEGILTSDRYGNMYPIDETMKYVKTGRTIRPYSDYEAVGISRYWYDNLRLGEVPETVEETKRYVQKCYNQMKQSSVIQSYGL